MKKVIIAWIAGGLGNQLFQYAFSKKMSIDTGAMLLLDTSFFKLNLTPRREFELFRFPVHAEILSDEHLNMLPAEIFCLEEERNLFYEEISTGSLDFPLYLKGYRQSWKYFHAIEKILRTELCLDAAKFSDKVRETGEMLVNTSSVGIHIRRTDYAANSYLGILPVSYYYRAVDYFKQRSGEFTFYVFSDDPVWVEASLDLPAPFQIIERNTGIEDFYLMSRCRNNIIANSSYSWWAAWLNPNPDKIVVVPRIWQLGNNLDVTKTDLIPPEWVCLW